MTNIQLLKYSLYLLLFNCLIITKFFAQAESIDAPVLNSVLTEMGIEKIKGKVSSVEISEHIAKDSAGVLKKVKPWLFDHTVRFNDKNEVYKIDYTNRSCVKNISYNIDPGKFEYTNLDSCSFNKTLTKEIWLYDQKGNIVEYSSSKNGTTDSKKEALYDENNKITDFKAFGSKDDLLRESSYKYDEKGKLIEFKQDYVSYKYLIKYIYNTNNKIQEEQRLDEKGNIERKTVYKYDAKLNLSEKSEYAGAVLSIKETFQYDASGKKIASLTYDGNNIVTFRSSAKYDINGKLSEQKDSYYSENKLYEMQLTKYYPNATVSERQTKTYDEAGVENSINTDKFDSNGNVTESVKIDVSDPKNPVKSIDKFEFDKAGNWTKRIKTFTGEQNKFVVTERKINYR